jgi:hypothetical protein
MEDNCKRSIGKEVEKGGCGLLKGGEVQHFLVLCYTASRYIITKGEM